MFPSLKGRCQNFGAYNILLTGDKLQWYGSASVGSRHKTHPCLSLFCLRSVKHRRWPPEAQNLGLSDFVRNFPELMPDLPSKSEICQNLGAYNILLTGDKLQSGPVHGNLLGDPVSRHFSCNQLSLYALEGHVGFLVGHGFTLHHALDQAVLRSSKK